MNDKTHDTIITAYRLALKYGLVNLTRKMISETLHVSPCSVNYRVGDMSEVRRAVIKLALRNKDFHLIAQGLAMRDPYARRAPLTIRRQALRAAAERGWI